MVEFSPLGLTLFMMRIDSSPWDWSSTDNSASGLFIRCPLAFLSLFSYCGHRYPVVLGDLKPVVHWNVVSFLFYTLFIDLVFVFITMAPSIFVGGIEGS